MKVILRVSGPGLITDWFLLGKYWNITSYVVTKAMVGWFQWKFPKDGIPYTAFILHVGVGIKMSICST